MSDDISVARKLLDLSRRHFITYCDPPRYATVTREEYELLLTESHPMMMCFGMDEISVFAGMKLSVGDMMTVSGERFKTVSGEPDEKPCWVLNSGNKLDSAGI